MRSANLRNQKGMNVCMHVHEITEAAGTEEAEADAESMIMLSIKQLEECRIL